MTILKLNVASEIRSTSTKSGYMLYPPLVICSQSRQIAYSLEASTREVSLLRYQSTLLVLS